MSGSSNPFSHQHGAATSEQMLSSSVNVSAPLDLQDGHQSMAMAAWEVNQRVQSLESVFEQTQSTLEILVDKFSGHQEKMNEMERLISLLEQQFVEQKKSQQWARSGRCSSCLWFSLPFLSLISFALFALYMASFSVDTWRQDLQLVRFSVRLIEGFFLLVLAGSVNHSAALDLSRRSESRDFSAVQLLSSICAAVLMIDTAKTLYAIKNSTWSTEEEASDLANLTLSKGSIDPFHLFQDMLLSFSYLVLLVWKLFLSNQKFSSFGWEWIFTEYPVFFGFLYFGLRLAAGILSNTSSRELAELIMSVAYIFGGVFFAFLSIKLGGSENEPVQQVERNSTLSGQVARSSLPAEGPVSSDSTRRTAGREEGRREEGTSVIPVAVSGMETRERELSTHFSSRNSDTEKEQKQV